MSTYRDVSKLLVAAALLVVPAGAQAQLNSNQAQVQLNATPFPESLTLTAGPSQINFSISSHAVSDGDQPLITTVNYVLDPASGARSATWSFYFAQPEALVNGGSTISSDRVSASIGGTAYQTFSSPTPFSGPTGIVLPFGVSGSGGAQTDLNLRIDARGIPLLPGAYTGTLFIQAQVL